MGFFATIIAILIAGDFIISWCADRLLRGTPHARWSRAVVGSFFLFQIAGLVLVLSSRVQPSLAHFISAKPITAAIYLWHLTLLPPLLILCLAGLCWRAVLFGGKRLTGRKAAPVKRTENDVTRRTFLRVAAAAAPAVLTLGATAISLPQLNRLRLRRLTLRLPQLPLALDGLTIAHVTDVHVGRFTSGPVLDTILRTTNSLAADLVILTGDLINYEIRDLPVALDLVSRMQSRYGVFMCEGNHDLMDDAAAFGAQTRAAGVRLLVNEAEQVQIGGEAIQLLGLQWGLGRTHSPQAARGDAPIAASMQALLQETDPTAFRILLAHHPHAFDHATDIPLTLAGHTHGGQLMLNSDAGFGPLLFRYWSGVYTRGDQHLVVSNGTGNWFPLRTAAPAEIIHITLRKA
ncbi:MAG TPA: metallophosphoesterase [Chthoniobacteraceae bacterium]